MKNSIRLGLAVLALVLAAFASAPRPAHALPLCDHINGWACFKPNQFQKCNGNPGICYCDPDTLIWEC